MASSRGVAGVSVASVACARSRALRSSFVIDREHSGLTVWQHIGRGRVNHDDRKALATIGVKCFGLWGG